MKEKRKQQVLKRKNFLPTLIFTLLLWLSTAGLVYFVDPETFLMIPVFFILFFTTLLFTFSLIFANTRRGLIGSISLTFFLLLSFFGVGNILNLFLIVAIAISIELYLAQK